MDAIKKQASKLREQVAKQQQAILRHLGQLGHEAVMVNDADQEYHQQLQNLYKSTRSAKHFQRDIARGVEGFILTSKKQMEITRKLAEDCCKYGIENQSDAILLSRAASEFGTSHVSMEDHRENMLGIFASQVCEPLRESIAGAPLEDARHLTHQYDRVRQEFEAKVADVLRRKSKYKDSSPENLIKLKNAEARLTELRSSMLALGREATEAMLSVEDQQQQITFQKLLAMVHADRSYHQNIIPILERLHSEMILEEQLNESSLQSASPQGDGHTYIPSSHEDTTNRSDNQGDTDEKGDEDENGTYFIAKVIHSFDAHEEGELSLTVDDHVVVRKVAPNGWSEGECNGKAGWFPSAYVQKRDQLS